MASLSLRQRIWLIVAELIRGKRHNQAIDGHCPDRVKVGKNCIFSPSAVILAHDSAPLPCTNKRIIATTIIGDEVFVGANAVILAGIKVGNRVIIGAGSIVTEDIPDNSVVVGNPARIIGTVDDYLRRRAC